MSLARADLKVLQDWIAPQSRVLDLGCGDGTLLRQLMDNKAVQGYGLEIDPDQILSCVGKGVNVVEQNLDKGLANFTDKSFDTVVMTLALQAMERPDEILDEMLRVGEECIVTFPNFGSWRARLFLAVRGRMPVTKQLSYQWYNTPNIHFCTVHDFEILCREKGLNIIDRRMVSQRKPDTWLHDLSPNLFAQTALYRLSK